MPMHYVRAGETVARAKTAEACSMIAQHIREAAVAGALAGAGYSPTAAIGLSRQYVTTGVLPRVAPWGIPGVMGIPTPGVFGVPTPGILGLPGIVGPAPLGIPTGIPAWLGLDPDEVM